MRKARADAEVADHCRIGSLEIWFERDYIYEYDHCRIGSLETWKFTNNLKLVRSLPHRQLRNMEVHEQSQACSITAA